MPGLRTEEQELVSEVQEWATDIFAAKGKKRVKRQKLALPGVADAWPSHEQPTPMLSQLLDEGPTRGRVTHALRAEICDTLRLPGVLASAGSSCAAQLANAAALAHVSTAAVRSLVDAMKLRVGLWAALQRGAASSRAALAASPSALERLDEAMGPQVSLTEREAWCRWVRSSPPGALGDPAVAPPPAAKAEDAHGSAEAAASSLPGVAELAPEPPAPGGLGLLRPYQREALEAVGKASPSNCCVVLPCGAGKTKLGAALACDFLEKNSSGCVVVLCLRREGMRQWARELQESWGVEALEASAGSAGGEALRAARVVLVTYHRMLSDRRRAPALADANRLSWEDDGIGEGGALDAEAGGAVASRFVAAPQGLLLADECHMVPAPRIGELLQALLASRKRLVGLTATLLREGMGDGAEGGEAPWPVLGSCVYRQTFARLAPEFLAPVRCVDVQVPQAGKWRALFKERPLAAAVCLSKGKWEVLEHLLALHADSSLLVVVERCEQARLIASTFGIMPIDGSVPASQLKDILARFRARQIPALVATHVLDDSLDFPELSVMIQMGGHFASRRQEQQRLGRLLRWGPEKRRRWEETGEEPTFYVLVHKGTVEERMSKHRTRSVAGVSYEQVPASTVTSPPFSALRCSELFRARSSVALEAAGALSSSAAEADASARRMEDTCFELSERVAGTLPGGARPQLGRGRGVLLSEVRSWLRGGELKLTGKEELAADCSEGETGDEASDTGFDSDDQMMLKQSSGSESSSSSSSSSTSSSSSAPAAAARRALPRAGRRCSPTSPPTSRTAASAQPAGGSTAPIEATSGAAPAGSRGQREAPSKREVESGGGGGRQFAKLKAGLPGRGSADIELD